MPTTLDEIKGQLFQLSKPQRAELAVFLLDSLEDDEDPEAVEAAWEVEVRRRMEEMDSGKVQGIPAEEVFAELRKKYS